MPFFSVYLFLSNHAECFKTVLVQKIYLLAVTAHSSLEKKNKNKQLLAEKVRRETKFTHTGFPPKKTPVFLKWKGISDLLSDEREDKKK